MFEQSSKQDAAQSFLHQVLDERGHVVVSKHGRKRKGVTHLNQIDTLVENRVKRQKVLLDNTQAFYEQEKKDNELAKQSRQASSSARHRRALQHKSTTRRVETKQWQQMIGLYQLWIGYIDQLVLNTSSSHPPPIDQIQSKLIKADYHGAFVSVVAAKNPCLIGIQGLLIKETANTFEILCIPREGKNSAKIKKVCKQGVLFQIHLSHRFITIDATNTKQSSTTHLTTIDATNTKQSFTTHNKQHCDIGGQLSHHFQGFQLYGSQIRVRSSIRSSKRWNCMSFDL